MSAGVEPGGTRRAAQGGAAANAGVTTRDGENGPAHRPATPVEPSAPDSRQAARLELEALRARLEEAEEMLRAIRLGEVDALVVQSPEGPRTYTLVTADEAYRRLVEQIPEAALTVSTDGVILYSNGRLPELLGLPADVLQGRTLAHLAAPEERVRIRELFERARHEGTSGEVTLRGTEDGPGIPFHLSLSPLHSGGFHGICAVATDLREQRRRDQVAADERLTRAILEFAGTAILVCDGSGRILRANRMAADLVEPSVGDSFDATLPEGPSFAELVRDAEAGGAAEARELMYTGLDGRRLWLIARARRIGEDAASENPRWVITLDDATHRKQIETERARLFEAEREARARAEAANQAKTQFLAVMSHELRTPLSAVIGYADLLQTGVAGAANSAQLQYVQRIKASAWHLLGLIEGILTFSRVEAGKETVRIEGTEIAAVAREAAELVAAQAAEKQIDLRVNLPDAIPPAATDSAKLRQILVNLLANAVKFTDRGCVTLALEQSGPHAIFRVQDTGQGIPAKDLQRIFEPFVQGDQSRTRRNGGTGLGLTIARHFAELIGAEITVESESGVGSTFSVSLPLAT